MFRWVAVPVLLAAALVGCRGASSSDPSNPTSRSTSAALPATQTATPGCTPALAHASGDSNGSSESGGVERTYILHVPARYEGSMPTPLVLAFHGFTLNADFMSDTRISRRRPTPTASSR